MIGALGCFCPCILTYKNAKKVDEDAACLHCCCLGCGGHMLIRRELRLWYGIERNTGQDCMYAACCGSCLNCQIANEMEARD